MMKLKSIQYSQYDGQARAWRLEDGTFGDINLVVGQNATGKTKTLKVVSDLANLLSGDVKRKPESAQFYVVFDDDGVEIQYWLQLEDQNVVREELIQNGQTLLTRGADGTGYIFAEKLNLNLHFQPPADELAVVSRRDTIQHPFLQRLYNWGKAARYFRFGTLMGQTTYLIRGVQEEVLNLKDSNQPVLMFHEGQARYGEHYERLVMDDMTKIGYELEEIALQTIGWMGTNGRVQSGISIKEKDLAAQTYHHEISSGLFRALSLIIQLNYSLLASLPSCIIIDDCGEGLDYIRSTALINLLIEKVEGTEMQLIMSTNDRFVMNSVPLQYWSVIRRFPHKAKLYNYRNSKDIFDDFEFTGLSNFDFFASDYLERGQ